MTMNSFTGRDPTRPVAPAFTKLSEIAANHAKRKMAAGLLSDPAMLAKLDKGGRNGRSA